MQAPAFHRGEMSHAPGMSRLHRTPVSDSVDPAARRAKRLYSDISASSIGIELAVAVILPTLVGRWLDAKAGTGPWLMILLLVLGFAAGMRGVMRAVKKMDREARDEEAGRG
jgi:F0F1-type ATP synthase assembly protein I